MEDLLKKVLYTGVGLVTTTIEKMQKTVDEMVNEGKMSESEGKKVIDDLLNDIEQKKGEYETKLRGTMDKVLAKFDFPTKDEVVDLKAKIADLEEQLAAKNAKKTTTKAKKREEEETE